MKERAKFAISRLDIAARVDDHLTVRCDVSSGGVMRNEDQPDIEADKAIDLPASEQPDNLRRNMLRFAALGGAAVVTVRPGIAQAAASAMKCSIPVPDSANSTKWIRNSDGALVAKNTAKSIPGPSSPLAGEDVKNSLRYGTTYPGYTSAQTTTWNKYINNLTVGKQGYTCFASVQNPAN